MLNSAKRVHPPTFWQSLRATFFARTDLPPRIFSEIDYYRLQGLLTKQHMDAVSLSAARLKQLRKLMNRGLLYPCKEIPDNLITMNSTIQLRSRRGSVFTVELVYPRNVDRTRRKTSVLSTLGLELIGRLEGEPILRHTVIEKILYQPERLGNYYT